MNNAVIYLRSSKDRSDVSIDAQRRALRELAQQRQIIIVGEYADAVESGKDDDRPAFQSMLRDMRLSTRSWDTVLVLDTARIARRRHLSLIFEEQECKKRGIRVIYNSVPDSDPITEMLLKSILQAMDEWHSLTSKAKGLAGMAENIKQGWRAGGRAPRGYKLELVATGAVREGVAVTKSRLVSNDESMLMRTYFQERIRGTPRTKILEKLGVDWAVTTLIDIERNALTYAGHTVWNRHTDRSESASKYRPREEWVIQKNTHEPIISDADAEAILAKVGVSNRRVRTGNRTYLLAGLMSSPDGIAWHGDSGYYRNGKGRKLVAENVESAVVDLLMEKFAEDSLAQIILNHYKALGKKKPNAGEITQIKIKINALDHQAGVLADLIPETTKPQALLRKIEIIEKDREALETALQRLEGDAAVKKVLNELKLSDIRKILKVVQSEINHKDTEGLRNIVVQFVDNVIIDPDTCAATVTFKIANITGDKLASPRETELIPPYLGALQTVILHRRRA